MGIIEKAAGRLGHAKLERVAAAGAFAEAPIVASVVDITPPPRLQSELPPDLSSRPAAAGPPKTAPTRIELALDLLHRQGFITPEAGRSAVAEEFRAIKRTLLDRIESRSGANGRRSNLIMVTSCLPGEGKTFCSINLAMSIAMELDHTVLLVDADVARPSMLRSLGVSADGGLMDVLLERRTDLAEVMLKTNVSTLSVVPAGEPYRNSTELLASKSMSNLLDEMANRYSDRVVIFDSPPLLLTSEARVLASQMGQIVVVVEAEKTTQKALKTALRQIEGCPNVNLVYNKAKAFAGAGKYGYYAYYP